MAESVSRNIVLLEETWCFCKLLSWGFLPMIVLQIVLQVGLIVRQRRRQKRVVVTVAQHVCGALTLFAALGLAWCVHRLVTMLQTDLTNVPLDETKWKTWLHLKQATCNTFLITAASLLTALTCLIAYPFLSHVARVLALVSMILNGAMIAGAVHAWLYATSSWTLVVNHLDRLYWCARAVSDLPKADNMFLDTLSNDCIQVDDELDGLKLGFQYNVITVSLQQGDAYYSLAPIFETADLWATGITTMSFRGAFPMARVVACMKREASRTTSTAPILQRGWRQVRLLEISDGDYGISLIKPPTQSAHLLKEVVDNFEGIFALLTNIKTTLARLSIKNMGLTSRVDSSGRPTVDNVLRVIPDFTNLDSLDLSGNRHLCFDGHGYAWKAMHGLLDINAYTISRLKLENCGLNHLPNDEFIKMCDDLRHLAGKHLDYVDFGLEPLTPWQLQQLRNAMPELCCMTSNIGIPSPPRVVLQSCSK